MIKIFQDPLVAPTFAMAERGHKGQFRDKTEAGKNVPYFVHPQRCAKWWWEHSKYAPYLRKIHGVKVMLCHDLKEDAKEVVSDQEIIDIAGFDVFMDVWWLTSPDKVDPAIKELNRATRRHIVRRKLSQAPLHVKRFKLIDRLDNLNDGFDDDAFTAKYLRETHDLLRALEESDSYIREFPEHYEIRAILNKGR